MKYVLATVIATSSVAANMRLLARYLDRDEMDDMFNVGLNAAGTGAPTHFISSGYMPRPFLRAMRDPALMYNTAKAAWEDRGEVFPLTQAQVTNRLNNCTVVIAGDVIVDGVPVAQNPVVVGDALPESPHETLARVNLKHVA